MSKQLFDKEIRLPCSCGDPHHFIHLGFCSKDGKYSPYQHSDDLAISSQLWLGPFWKRLKEAIGLLFRGWITYNFDAYLDEDEIKKMKEFLYEVM